MALRCSIDAAVSARHPIWLGLTEWTNTNVTVAPVIWRADLDQLSDMLGARFPDKGDLSSDPRIAAGRTAYVAYGINPKRYAPASEALIRRAISGKPIPSINTFVDFNNVLSLTTRCPVGSYNAEAVRGGVLLRLGRAGESYTAIGNDTFQIENFPTLCDDIGPFGGITRDSTRTMVVQGISQTSTFVMSFVEPHTSGISETIQQLNRRAQERGLGQGSAVMWIGG
jgi:DNA/RNA-binding domain of Phe-tRNA-synthetase-like protein